MVLQASPGSISGCQISDQEFEALSRLVYERAGIQLPEFKKALLVGRLQKILRTNGFNSFNDYYNYVIGDETGAALSELIDRISTNHTFFLREPAHFDFFRDHALPEARERHANDRDLRVWCAASSTGEEPYTLQILMREFFGQEYSRWSAGLLATDISSRVLDLAREGIYDEEQVAPLPKQWLQKWFQQLDSEHFQVKSELRSDLTLRRFNLMNKKLPFHKPFDAIFCRNVMIYFDAATKEDLVGRLAEALVPDGYLFIGHAESIGRNQPLLRYVQPSTYQRIR
ncbi:MAG: chemotaxis protein CheR [Planctomycetota bacterium]|nr:MAG: chemotaxis protein CheR [Planctomycetota bacterium]